MTDAIRLLFEYRDGAYVPLAPQKVRMVVPHAPTTRDAASAQGRFVELRSADDEVVSAHRIGESGPPRVEYPTGDEKEPFGHTEPPPGAVVSVVVEADERATHAALVDVSAGRGLDEVVRRDLAVISLDEGGEK